MRVTDPLVDTLFRPTTSSMVDASAAPVRATGTHSRAGNAMIRTRAALLAGAARAVVAGGTKISMTQVAGAAGVAKATLYNHFRTREAVLSALVLDQVRAIVSAQAGKPLEAALADAAMAISESPVRRGIARLEPATLAALARIEPSTEGWQLARTAVEDAVVGAGFGGTDTVVRWLASFLITPAGASAIASDVAVLVAGLPSSGLPSSGPPSSGLVDGSTR